MNGSEIKQKIWNKIHEYAATIGRGEKPAFIVLHTASVMAIELHYWENPNDTCYYPPRGLGDPERVFGVPVIRYNAINEDEILLGITPLQKREL